MKLDTIKQHSVSIAERITRGGENKIVYVSENGRNIGVNSTESQKARQLFSDNHYTDKIVGVYSPGVTAQQLEDDLIETFRILR